MKLLKKISIGTVNNIRGGLKDVVGRIRVITIAGIANGYAEKTSETMGISYAFKGEFRAVNINGEEAAAPIAYLPEPAQGLLKAQLDGIGESASVEFGFHFFAVEDATAIKGYYWECVPLMEARKSTALENLTARLSFDEVAKTGDVPALAHDAAAETPALGHDKPAGEAKGKGKGK
jgi:hypothetical protein